MAEPSEDNASKPAKGRTPKKGSKKNGKPGKPKKQKLDFPADQLHKMLLQHSKSKGVEPAATVFLTSVDQYVAHEIIELAGNHSHTRASDTISEEDVRAVILGDEEFRQLFHELVHQ